MKYSDWSGIVGNSKPITLEDVYHYWEHMQELLRAPRREPLRVVSYTEYQKLLKCTQVNSVNADE